MAMLYINGAEMPSPAELSVELEDIGDAGYRNALGQRLVDRIAVKRTIELRWPQISAADAAELLGAVAQEVFFSAEYHDPETGGLREGVFRAVQRSAEMFRVDGGAAVWARISMKWEEK
jgi:hypothetical protein